MSDHRDGIAQSGVQQYLHHQPTTPDWSYNNKELVMKTIMILPAIVLGAASLVLSTGVVAGTRNSVNPVTGIANATGNVISGVGHVATGVVGGVGYGATQVVKGVAHGTTYIVNGVVHTTAGILSGGPVHPQGATRHNQLHSSQW